MASMRAKLKAARALAKLRKLNIPTSADPARAHLIYPYVVDPNGNVYLHQNGKLQELRQA